MAPARRIVLAALSAGGIALAGRAVRAQELDKMNVGTPPSDGVKALLYGAHAGIFRKAGLDVTIVPMMSGSAAMGAVAGGSMQVAFVNLLSAIAAYARGIHFEMVAPGGIYTSDRPYALLFVKKDAPIHSGRDLNGKTIASPALKDLTSTATLAWIDRNGGDAKTVRAIELPASAFLPALDDGRIDAVTLLSPYLDDALASGKYRVLGKSFDAISKRFLSSGWVAAADAVAKDPGPYLRFGRAMHEAIAYSNGHLADTVDLVADYTKMDPQVIVHGTRILDAEYVSVADVQPLIDVSLRYGVIDKTFDARGLIFASAERPGR